MTVCLFKRTAAPTESIWGAPDLVSEVAPGWWQVSTPRHGGFILSAERVARIPDEHLNLSFGGNGWHGFFEEDCDWSIPVFCFPNEYSEYLKRVGSDKHKEVLSDAEAVLNQWILRRGAA